jgi:BirA family transcriptional regulator, biotin operon repressor / biotin---[acetyl-CoA-carboxylase] ligase
VLGGRWPRVEVVAQTESTNADLLADRAAPDRTVLVAERQRAGRGRLNRVWTSPPGAGLTFSVLLRPTVPIAAWGWLPLLAGVALRAAVASCTGVQAALKWPNDLLVGPAEAKAAGILAQTNAAAVVIGIGLNVTTTQAELPAPAPVSGGPSAGRGATSLALAGATALDRTDLLVAILARLDSQLTRWADAGGDAEASGVASAYRAVCASIGREVVVTSTDGTAVTGWVDGIESDGRLRLHTGAGPRVIGAGDVEHLRSI